MKNELNIFVALSLTLLVSATASAQTKRKPPRRAPVTRTVLIPPATQPPPQAAAPPTVVLRADLSGRLDGAIYTNNLLGVRVPLPAGWQASDPEVKPLIGESVEEKAGEMIENKPASTQRGLRESVGRTSHLLIATKMTDDLMNPLVLIISEDISIAPVVASPKQYAAAMLRITGSVPDSPMVFDPEVKNERIGAVEYAVLTTRPRDPQIAPPGMEQRIYVAVRRSHALLFVFTFVSEAQRQACMDILRAVEYW